MSDRGKCEDDGLEVWAADPQLICFLRLQSVSASYRSYLELHGLTTRCSRARIPLVMGPGAGAGFRGRT